MQTLELECPACGELLELDMGFAGGVCRCSACGTLMTVPQDAAAGAQAEQLSRPDRPDDPSGLSGMADAAEAAPTPHRQRATTSRRSPKSKRGKPDRRGKKKGKPRGRSSARAGETIEQGVYTTASGRKVQIDRTTNVPVARTRRTGVRIATIAVFFSIVGAVVLVGAIAVIYMIQNPKGGKPVDPSADAPVVDTDPTQFIYSKGENPYLLEQPNALGLPLKGTVAIILQTGPDNENWIVTMAEMIGTGLRQPGSEAEILVLATGPEGLRAFRDQPTVPTVVTPEALMAFVQDEGGAGSDAVEEALQEALGSKPDSIILVLGQPASADIIEWGRLMENHPGVALHGVLVDGYSQAFEDWVLSREDGYYISLVTDDLLDWRDAWEAEGEDSE
ncbi:hypothetical protein OT109_00545 [Phycisphaeraceae bacterium D3-23]